MNFRDVGGLPASTGLTRRGVLFRSGNLASLGARGLDAFRALGIRRIIDLRDDDEVQREPSPFVDSDIATQREPLFLGSVASFFADDISLDELYERLANDSAKRVVHAVRGITSGQPVLVHCTVGKDRTGVTVALALAAAGVEREAVVADYARTESLLPEQRNRRVVSALRAAHPHARHLEDLATRSPAPVMRRFLAQIDETYGSAAGYLEAHGMSHEEIALLQRILIDEG
nr:tyrosine-protein phosphatase [Microbacterium endophyticum]